MFKIFTCYLRIFFSMLNLENSKSWNVLERYTAYPQTLENSPSFVQLGWLVKLSQYMAISTQIMVKYVNWIWTSPWWTVKVIWWRMLNTKNIFERYEGTYIGTSVGLKEWFLNVLTQLWAETIMSESLSCQHCQL